MRVLVVTGEASGDAHAAGVAVRLAAAGAEVSAVGGPALAAAGARIVHRIESLSVLGSVEVIRRLPHLLAFEREIATRLRDGGFDLFLPVDFPGMNLRLAAAAHRAGVPVLYYVGPQVWAWRPGRLPRMRGVVDHVALVLPFEKPLYDAAGVPATFVGHPLLDDPIPPPAEPDTDVALFPGSRPQEVLQHLPVLLDAARRARARHPGLRVRVSRAPTVDTELLHGLLRRHGFDPEREVDAGPARQVMARSRMLLVASGTATLEAALAARPFAVLYRTGRVNYALARRLVRVPHIALANLVAGEGVVREYVQDAVEPEALAGEIELLLFDAAERERIVRGLQRVRERLGEPGVAARVSALALGVAAGALGVPAP